MHVKQIKNINIKSFHNYIAPVENSYFNNRKNIIFGYNGKGKSALAQAIYENYKKINSTVPNIDDKVRYFNCDYIKNNLLLSEDESTINGVVAHFGKQDVDTQSKIDKLENEKESKNQSLEALKKQRRELGTKILDRLTDIYLKRETRSGSSKTNNPVSKANVEDNFGNCLTTYKDNYNKVIKSGLATDELLMNYTASDDMSDNKEAISNLVVPVSIIILTNDEIQNIYDICNSQYNEDSIPAPDIVDWLKKGQELHKNRDTCLFCKGHLNHDDIDKMMEDISKSRKDADSTKLKKYESKLANINDALNQLIKSLGRVGETFKNYTEFINELTKLTSYIDDFNKQNLERKIKSMDTQITVDSQDLIDCMGNVSKVINQIEESKKTQIETIDKQNEKKNDLVKGAIGKEVKEDKELNNEIIGHDKLIGDIKSIENDIASIDSQIKILKSSSSAYKNFADDINETFDYLQIDLKLELADKHYVIKHAKEDTTLMINDISEGEKNLLALLYFYSELFDEKEKNHFKTDIELIIIDDPISSLDDTNKVFILTLLTNMFDHSESEPQLFVLTHIWEDFADIFKFYHDRTHKETDDKGNVNPTYDYSFWEVKKNIKDSYSYIVPFDNKKNIRTPYEHAFATLHESYLKYKNDNNDTLDDDIYLIPNLLRRVIEQYCEIRTGISGTYINLSTLNKVLYNGDANTKQKDRINLLIKVCNYYSHRNDSVTPDEIYKSLKFFMERIKEIDNVHYSSMTVTQETT